MMVDHERIERAVTEILFAIGEDPERDGLLETPKRVARMYAEVCSGLQEDPSHHLEKTFDVGHAPIPLPIRRQFRAHEEIKAFS